MPTTTDHTPLAAHPDYREFLSAIVRDPEDDTVRLGFADWLDEMGDGEWAEYIRASVELARMPGDKPLLMRGAKLHLRCEHLLPTIEPRIRRGAKCGRCYGLGKLLHWGHAGDTMYDCQYCHGVGWMGSLARTETCVNWSSNHENMGPDKQHIWYHDVTWHRGFPHRVHATMEDVFADGEPTEWALALMREWPVGEVVMTDVGFQPNRLRGGETLYYADKVLPECVILAETRGEDGYFGRKSPDLARTALASAVCRVLRQRAGVESGVPPVGGIE